MPLLISTLFGATLYVKSNLTPHKSYSHNFAFGFFIGISSLIVLTRVLSLITSSYRLAIISTIIFQLFYVIYSKTILFGNFINWRLIITNFLYITLIFILTTLYWLRDLNDNDQPIGSVGTLHSYRYAWISNLVTECDYFPILGQNTGQSTLTAISNILSGHQSPYLYLSLWLSISIFALYTLIAKIIMQFGLKKSTSNLAALIFFTLGSGLSITYVAVIDSGYPIYLNGYTDTMLGIGILIIIINYINRKILSRLKLFDSIVLVFLLINCFFVAPQNLLAILMFIFILIAFYIIKIPSVIPNPFIKFLLFVMPVVAAIPFGGFLTPKQMLSKIKIPNVDQSAVFMLDFIPGFPFNLTSPSDSVQESEKIVVIFKGLIDTKGISSSETVWFIENLFLTNLRVLFFPLLGMLIAFVLINKLKKGTLKLFRDLNYLQVQGFFLAGIISVMALITIPTVLKISGYKWELTRLALPAIILGSLVLSIVMAKQIIEGARYQFLSWTIYTVSTIGPFIYFITVCLENFMRLYSNPDFNAYLGSGPVILSAYCGMYG